LKRTRTAVAFARWNFFIVLEVKNNIKFQCANRPELEAECDWKEGWRHRWYDKDTLSG